MTSRSPDRFDIMLVDLENGVELWTAVYKRTLTAGVGWTDGDRVGYKCAYMFLMRGTQPVGRATFQIVPGAGGYTMVNDRYMKEGVRYFDGRLATGGQMQLNDCPPVTADYSESFEGNDLPTVKFQQVDGKTLETRTYSVMVHADNVTFQQKSKTAKEIAVVAYRNKQPVIVVYYSSLVSDVIMTSSI